MKGNNVCTLCLSADNDEIDYGELLSHGNFVVHHFCLLFAPALQQNGFHEDCVRGLQGFLLPDIKKEIFRVKKLKCWFCHKKGANLGCFNKKCPKAYHTGCALKNKVIFEFTSNYKTYCSDHKKIIQNDRKNLDSTCGICYDSLLKKYPQSILMPCCKNSWFHKRCLQKYAVTSGVFFKCPLCGSKETTEKLKLLGIPFIHRDALWELEENAFEEIYRPLTLSCESAECASPQKHADKPYKFKMCNSCGSVGIHHKCFVGTSNSEFTCRSCSSIFERLESKSRSSKAQKSPNVKITETRSEIKSPTVIQCSSCACHNSRRTKKPKSFAATILGESDATTTEEEEILVDIKSRVSRPPTKKPKIDENNDKKNKKPKSFAATILGESDVTSSDEDEHPKKSHTAISSSNIQRNHRQKKPKSFAALILGESDVTSSDEDYSETAVN